MKEFIPELYRTRVLLAPQATGTGAVACAAPTAGVNAITVRGIAAMGNAADLVLTLKYADDASGTNATDFPSNVLIYKNGVKQTSGVAFTIGESSGNFIVDFCVDPGLIPAGKTIGISYGNSNAANLLATVIIEDTNVKPTAT